MSNIFAVFSLNECFSFLGLFFGSGRSTSSIRILELVRFKLNKNYIQSSLTDVNFSLPLKQRPKTSFLSFDFNLLFDLVSFTRCFCLTVVS